MDISSKIAEQRKKAGWSQEELAEKLDVSRQSVSKWESAASVPDINRIVELAELFGVTTDYLLLDESHDEADSKNASIQNVEANTEDTHEKNTSGKCDLSNEMLNRKTDERYTLDRDTAEEFLSASENYGRRLAFGVRLCILSPVVLIFLAGVSELYKNSISDNMAALTGLIVLLILVAAAVYIFINSAAAVNRFEYIRKGDFSIDRETEIMVRSTKMEFEPEHIRATSMGVVLCILSVIPLFIVSMIEGYEEFSVFMVPVLLIIVSFAVNIFVKQGTVRNAYSQLLKEDEFTPEGREKMEKQERFGGIYWPVIVAIYLAISFITNAWDFTWIIWPVAALLFVAINSYMKK